MNLFHLSLFLTKTKAAIAVNKILMHADTNDINKLLKNECNKLPFCTAST